MPGFWTSPPTYTGGQLIGATDLNIIRDNLLWIGNTDGVITQAVFGTTSGTLSTASTTVVLAESTTISTAAIDNIVVWYSAAFTHSQVGVTSGLYVQIDSTGWSSQLQSATSPQIAYAMPINLVYRFASVAAGTHTISIGWSTGSGTLSMAAGLTRCLLVLEIRR